MRISTVFSRTLGGVFPRTSGGIHSMRYLTLPADGYHSPQKRCYSWYLIQGRVKFSTSSEGGSPEEANEGEVGANQHDTPIPKNIRRFITVEEYDPKISIKCIENEVELLEHLCKVLKVDVKDDLNLDVVGEGALWPNQFLMKFRSSVQDLNNHRLKELWTSSSSHGISWDRLDELYIKFKEARDASINEWNEYSLDIVDYASKVAKDKILSVIDKCPPRLHRKITHLLYKKWYDRYMSIYDSQMLSRYLKGEVTDCILDREIYEVTQEETNLFDYEKSQNNPHFINKCIKK